MGSGRDIQLCAHMVQREIKARPRDVGRGIRMTEKDQPDPKKMEVLRNFPMEIMKRLTKEEIRAFLFDEEWPDSLQEKLKDYLE